MFNVNHMMPNCTICKFRRCVTATERDTGMCLVCAKAPDEAKRLAAEDREFEKFMRTVK